MKRTVLAIVLVFIAWSILDFLIHGVILQASYAATMDLWRPSAEMKMGLMHVVVLISSIAFVFIYKVLCGEKDAMKGMKYGIWFGVAVGVGMGYGTYSFMPIPYSMALTWFLGAVVEGAAAGLLVGSVGVVGETGTDEA